MLELSKRIRYHGYQVDQGLILMGSSDGKVRTKRLLAKNPFYYGPLGSRRSIKSGNLNADHIYSIMRKFDIDGTNHEPISLFEVHYAIRVYDQTQVTTLPIFQYPNGTDVSEIYKQITNSFIETASYGPCSIEVRNCFSYVFTPLDSDQIANFVPQPRYKY